MKSLTYTVAGLLGAGAVAGGTMAVMQQPPTPQPTATQATVPAAPQVIAEPEIPTAPKPQPAPAAQPTPVATPKVQPTKRPIPASPAPKTAKQPRRQVTSCKVLMAIVRDSNPPLNVRSQPSIEGNIIGSLGDGEFVSVKQEQNGWFEISQPAGWIAKSKTVSRCGLKVERVRFDMGKTGTSISDELLGSGSHKYKLELSQGQTLTVKGAVGPMPAVKGPDGQYLTSMQDGQGTWSTKLPSNGEYTLEMDSNFRGYKYDFSVEVK